MGITDTFQDSAQRGQIEDFVKRYDQGQPWEGISDDEARQQHDQVAAQLDDQQYEESARESLQKLEPERRREFARELGVPETDDPQELARETARVHKEKPDMFGELMSNPAIKGAVAGIAAQAAKRFLKR
jgi:pyruvate dehydrogenase complex dehydrogenase (E1) component